MGAPYGINEKVLDSVTSANAYASTIIVVSGYSSIRLAIEEGNINAIKFKIEKLIGEDWYTEVAETTLSNAQAVYDVDPLCRQIKVSYKSSVAATHSTDINLWLYARTTADTQHPHLAVEKTADGSVKATAARLYGYVIAFDGVTAGDKVQIKDGGSGGTVLFTVIAAGTDETHEMCFPNGVQFATDLYHEETKTGGTIYATYIYE